MKKVFFLLFIFFGGLFIEFFVSGCCRPGDDEIFAVKEIRVFGTNTKGEKLQVDSLWAVNDTFVFPVDFTVEQIAFTLPFETQSANACKNTKMFNENWSDTLNFIALEDFDSQHLKGSKLNDLVLFGGYQFQDERMYWPPLSEAQDRGNFFHIRNITNWFALSKRPESTSCAMRVELRGAGGKLISSNQMILVK
jgi:hypothetical protein